MAPICYCPIIRRFGRRSPRPSAPRPTPSYAPKWRCSTAAARSDWARRRPTTGHRAAVQTGTMVDQQNSVGDRLRHTLTSGVFYIFEADVAFGLFFQAVD